MTTPTLTEPTGEVREADEAITVAASVTACSGCGVEVVMRSSTGPCGFERRTCPSCSKATLGPLRCGWRIFWWILAVATAAGAMVANLVLRDGMWWAPGGIGLLAFVLLCVDIRIRRKCDRGSVAPIYVAALTATILFAVLASTAGALVVTGLNNAYTYDVVLQEARDATMSEGYGEAIEFPTASMGEALCSGGDDYSTCIAMHGAMYNSVCVGQELTKSARNRCDDLREFVEEGSARAVECGYGCTTRGDEDDQWGWRYLHPKPDHVMIQNDDALPEISYREHCDFSLGPIQIGTCGESPSDAEG